MSLLDALDLAQQVTRLHSHGMPRGASTGWPSLDEYYTVLPGQLCIVTGWPGSGKSEWVDALCVNLWKQDWAFAVFSPENQPYEFHVAKLAEKITGKPFGAGPNQRIDPTELQAATLLIEDGWRWIVPGKDAEAHGSGISLEGILDSAAQAVSSKNSRQWGIVLDPWNEIDHMRPRDLSETEYISQSLTTIRRWARNWHVAVWLIAHPQKLRRDDNGKLPIPRPDSISGSQHWWNKADVAITVWRELADHSQSVEIHVQKVRFKHTGKPGLCTLRYDRVTGRYYDDSAKIKAMDDYRVVSQFEV